MSVICNELTGRLYPGYIEGRKSERKFFRVFSGGKKLFFEDETEYFNWSSERHITKKTVTSMKSFISSGPVKKTVLLY